MMAVLSVPGCTRRMVARRSAGDTRVSTYAATPAVPATRRNRRSARRVRCTGGRFYGDPSRNASRNLDLRHRPGLTTPPMARTSWQEEADLIVVGGSVGGL